MDYRPHRWTNLSLSHSRIASVDHARYGVSRAKRLDHNKLSSVARFFFVFFFRLVLARDGFPL